MEPGAENIKFSDKQKPIQSRIRTNPKHGKFRLHDKTQTSNAQKLKKETL